MTVLGKRLKRACKSHSGTHIGGQLLAWHNLIIMELALSSSSMVVLLLLLAISGEFSTTEKNSLSIFVLVYMTHLHKKIYITHFSGKELLRYCGKTHVLFLW